jgi:hypothetical protein
MNPPGASRGGLSMRVIPLQRESRPARQVDEAPDTLTGSHITFWRTEPEGSLGKQPVRRKVRDRAYRLTPLVIRKRVRGARSGMA